MDKVIALLNCLDLERDGLQQVKQQTAQKNFDQAAKELLHYFRNRKGINYYNGLGQAGAEPEIRYGKGRRHLPEPPGRTGPAGRHRLAGQSARRSGMEILPEPARVSHRVGPGVLVYGQTRNTPGRINES